MTFESSSREIAKTVLGLLIAVGAGYVGWVALHQKPIDLHLIYFSGGGVFFGALLVATEVVFETAKKMLSLFPSVKIGGGSPPTP